MKFLGEFRHPNFVMGDSLSRSGRFKHFWDRQRIDKFREACASIRRA